MATVPPPDDGDLWKMLEDVQEPTDVIDVTKLDSNKLLSLHTAIRNELYALGEMMEPTTDRGRELHSTRAACLVEMQSRGLR